MKKRTRGTSISFKLRKRLVSRGVVYGLETGVRYKFQAIGRTIAKTPETKNKKTQPLNKIIFLNQYKKNIVKV